MAAEYMDKIVHSTSFGNHLYLNTTSAFDCDDDSESETDNNGNKLQQLQDEMLLLMYLKNWQRDLCSVDSNHLNDDNSRPRKKAKYDTRKITFTNPTTGERSIMTYEYTVWFQNYVLNPTPQYKKWAKQFR